jgi:hypothetical protein
MARIKSKIPYILIADSEGHRFMIPENKQDDFYEWLEDIDEMNESGHNFAQYQLGGPVRFYEWETL